MSSTKQAFSWAGTAALASVSAMAVAGTGLMGFRAGRGETNQLAVQIQIQKTTIDQLADELERTRSERDKLQARVGDATPLPSTPAPSSARRASPR